MSFKVKKKGEYRTFETVNNHKIIVLDNQDYYAWIDTAVGHLIVQSENKHDKKKDLMKGKYYLFTANGEPDFVDNVDHFELEEGDRLHTYILPRGLPDNSNKKKKIIHTDEYIDEKKITEV